METLHIEATEQLTNKDIEGACSAIEDIDGVPYIVSQTGAVYSLDEGLQELYNTGGQPSGLTFDSANTAYICDMAHQSILCQTESGQERLEITELVKDYNGKPLLGPNSVWYHEENNAVYFTDSGPMGLSSLTNPVGSVFAVDLDSLTLTPIALRCLAHPWGVTGSLDGKNIYVAETFNNRILRAFCHPENGYIFSVFYEFNGRVGPSALAMSDAGLLYVGRYDFEGGSAGGVISVLSLAGELLRELRVSGSPEITGLSFSRVSPSTLYIVTPKGAFKITVPTDKL